MGFARLELARLPLEHRVRQALESLAEHHVLLRGWVESAEMQIRQFSLATAVTPFRREHHEIERVRALDLEPARAAIARFVGRIQRLRHQAFVSLRQCFV